MDTLEMLTHLTAGALANPNIGTTENAVNSALKAYGQLKQFAENEDAVSRAALLRATADPVNSIMP